MTEINRDAWSKFHAKLQQRRRGSSVYTVDRSEATTQHNKLPPQTGKNVTKCGFCGEMIVHTTFLYVAHVHTPVKRRQHTEKVETTFPCIKNGKFTERTKTICLLWVVILALWYALVYGLSYNGKNEPMYATVHCIVNEKKLVCRVHTQSAAPTSVKEYNKNGSKFHFCGRNRAYVMSAVSSQQTDQTA